MAYRLFVNGDGLSATDLNDAFGATGWTTYTPTVSSGLTVGNGIWAASYMQIGKTVYLRIRFTLGTTSAVTGALSLGLPVTGAIASYAAGLLTAGGTSYPAAVTSGTTSVNMYAQNAAGTYLTRANTSATIPGTWTSTDSFNLAITYEAA